MSFKETQILSSNNIIITQSFRMIDWVYFTIEFNRKNNYLVYRFYSKYDYAESVDYLF